MKDKTRREVMIQSSKIVGMAAGTMLLGGNFSSPSPARAAEINFPEPTCDTGGDSYKKILVVYASLCGTTGGVAETIGNSLCEKGASVDVRLIKNVLDLSPYHAVIIGSATRSSSWWPEAIEFVKVHQNTLSRIPVAYFVTCLALYHNTNETRDIARSYLTPVLEVAPKVHPVDLGLFAGVLNYDKLPFMYRMVMKYKMKKQGIPEGDFRDWDAIRAWAAGLISEAL